MARDRLSARTDERRLMVYLGVMTRLHEETIAGDAYAPKFVMLPWSNLVQRG